MYHPREIRIARQHEDARERTHSARQHAVQCDGGAALHSQLRARVERRLGEVERRPWLIR